MSKNEAKIKAESELRAAESDIALLSSGAVPIGGGWPANALEDAHRRAGVAHLDILLADIGLGPFVD